MLSLDESPYEKAAEDVIMFLLDAGYFEAADAVEKEFLKGEDKG